MATSLLLAACDSSTPPSRDAVVDQRTGSEARAGDAAPDRADGAARDSTRAPDGPCAAFPGCTGLCGNVVDKCTGEVHKCGGCPTGDVCNLETHTCNKALVTCPQLAAECGMIKNSCGIHISCGDCPAGQECDPDTNTCVACTKVTCQSLGYECGAAWLGCGPSTVTVDCGACTGGKICNQAFNLCEPACTHKPAADVCAAAKVASGVECGYVTDGCGAVVNCGGCPTGKACGIFGVANRCELIPLPDECAVLGKNCGTISSVCGGTVDCGTCTAPDVCNANNVCGPKCTPKKCADVVAGAVQCGTFPDGCNGNVSCPCAKSGDVCKPDHTCCTQPTCPAGSCNTTVPNPCTGVPLTCNTCTSGQVCNTATKQCVGKLDCNTLTPPKGGTHTECNDNAVYDRGDGVKFACPCAASQQLFCINDTLTQDGTCCKNVNTCPAGTCGTSVINSCTGATIACTCPPGSHCEGGVCVQDLTCSTLVPPAAGNLGDDCSNQAAFDNGAGKLLACPCKSGMACVDTGTGLVVTGSAKGKCVALKKCDDPAYKATGKAGDPCSNDPSSSFPNGAGGKLKCACNAGLACVDSTDHLVSGDTVGVCKPKKTCAGDYGATGAVGAPCSSTSYFDDGFGTKFACPCTTSGNPSFFNNKCVGGPPGVCTCAARACTCTTSGQSDGCGKAMSCPCGTGTKCNGSSTNPQCCPIYTCASLPAGIPAGACGAIPDSCMGTPINCPCDTSTKPNNKCSVTTGYGSCVCVPKTCAELGVGTWPNDGCGSPKTCTG